MLLTKLVSELTSLHHHCNWLKELQIFPAFGNFAEGQNCAYIIFGSNFRQKAIFSIFGIHGSVLRSIFTTQLNIYDGAFSQRWLMAKSR